MTTWNVIVLQWHKKLCFMTWKFPHYNDQPTKKKSVSWHNFKNSNRQTTSNNYILRANWWKKRNRSWRKIVFKKKLKCIKVKQQRLPPQPETMNKFQTFNHLFFNMHKFALLSPKMVLSRLKFTLLCYDKIHIVLLRLSSCLLTFIERTKLFCMVSSQ